MGFVWLATGVVGALEAGAIALAIGALLCTLAARIGRRIGWKPGTEIGIALVATLVLAAGVDGWDLFRLGIMRLESPFVIERTLGDIHDPGSLGTRVVFEFAGAVAGVMLGWYFAAVVPESRRRRRDRGAP